MSLCQATRADPRSWPTAPTTPARRDKEIQRRTQRKGWGKDQGRQRAAEGGGDPRRGRGGAPRHRKQSGAGRRGRGLRVGAKLGETKAGTEASGRHQRAVERQPDGIRPGPRASQSRILRAQGERGCKSGETVRLQPIKNTGAEDWLPETKRCGNR